MANVRTTGTAFVYAGLCLLGLAIGMGLVIGGIVPTSVMPDAWFAVLASVAVAGIVECAFGDRSRRALTVVLGVVYGVYAGAYVRDALNSDAVLGALFWLIAKWLGLI